MLVPVTVPSDTPSWNTSYCVTPTLSVDASQFKVNPLSVMPVAFSPVGMLGPLESLGVLGSDGSGLARAAVVVTG
ncbi:hypothetical protein D3C87_1551980 [compost metagenome]